MEASSLVPFVRQFIEAKSEWTGTASKLLAELKALAGDAAKAKDWPGNARGLSGRLKRLCRISVLRGSSSNGTAKRARNAPRIIHLTCQQDKVRDFASDASDASDEAKSLEENDIASDARGRNPAASEANADARHPAKTATQDPKNAADAKSRTPSRRQPSDPDWTPFDEESDL